MKNKAFTLVELIIVVSILGILAAIVIPQVQGHTVQAKESAAKSSLHTMRAQIALYKMEHDNFPGYVSGVALASPASIFNNQMAGISNAAGVNSSARVATGTYPFGPYISDIPENPFNNQSDVKSFTTSTAFADEVDGTTGWLYKVTTGEIALNWTGADDGGTNYYDY